MDDNFDTAEYYQQIARQTGKKYLKEVSKLSRIISRLRETEETLEKYRTLVESSTDPIFMLDKDKKFISCNRAFLDCFYHSANEIANQGLDLIIEQNEGYGRVETLLNHVVLSNGSHTFEQSFVRKNGSHIMMEATISMIETRSVQTEQERNNGYVGILRDITARIQHEAVLKAAEAKYRNIFENSTEGLFLKDSRGIYLNVNPAFVNIFNFDSPEALIASINDMKNDFFVDLGEYRLMLELLKENGLVENFESERFRKDGSRIWTTVNMRVIKGEDGNVRYYEGAVVDITQKKNLESQLRHALKLEAIGTLAGGIAHDFNNILTAIIGYGSLLRTRMGNDSALLIYVNQMLTSAEKAAALTQSLLAFSRKQSINLRPNNINEIVRDMEKLLERLLTEDIEFRFKLAEKDMTILSDRTQMEQILINLVTNARDALTDNRSLTIQTKLVEIGKDFISRNGFGKPGSYALLSVSDTGCGMDAKTREHIFEPFFTTKEAGKGTGLGLSTVYGIVKQHHGYITVDSTPGAGTIVHVYLPVIRTRTEISASALLEVRGGDETILVAEDNSEIRSLMKELLGGQGYAVIEAADGQEAVEKFAQYRERIRLAIIDVVMPKKNGKQVYVEIKALNPSVRTLFFSGYPKDVILDNIKGGFDFMSKPMMPDIFLNKIRVILDRNDG